MVSWRGRNVLVTGGTGFIGSSLVKRLVREGAKVHLLVRASSKPDALGPVWEKCARHVGSISDEASLQAAVAAAKPEAVFHLAKERGCATFASEAAATRSLGKILKGVPELRKFVRTVHDAPRRADDEALTAELAAAGLPVVALELFLVYGPGMPAGDFPRSMIAGERPAALSASIKDYVWIDDVVEAYLLASHASGTDGKTIPVGTGRGRSEADAAALLLRLLGSEDASPRAEGEGGGHPADAGPARAFLRWSPRVQLEQGLGRLIAKPAKVDAAIERQLMAPWLGDPGRGGKPAKATGAWTLIGKAAELYAKGDLAGASREAELFTGLMPGSAAGPAMKALLAAQTGDRAEAERWLDAAGSDGWPRALRGLLRSRWGESQLAREDLDATRLVERSAWASAARAEAYNGAGLYWSALTELKQMRKVMPGSPEPDVRAAVIHLEQAQYEEAAACLARAAKTSPKDPSVPRQLSRVRFVEGNLPGARAAIEKAAKLAPGDESIRRERLRLCVLQDDVKAAEALLALPWAPGVVDFWRAYIACRAKDFKKSAALFEKAAASGDASLAATARFYVFVVKTMAEAPKPAPPPPGRELIVMGLGFRHPYQTSVECVRDLAAAEEFFSNLSDSTVADMLGLFGVPMRTIVFRRTDGQSTPCARIVLRAMKSLKRGAVVTRGMPNYYGRLAYRLVQDCRKLGITCRIPPSVSIADFLPALAGRTRGTALGREVRDTNDLRRMDPRVTTVIYNFSSGARRAEQARELAALRAPEDPVWLMAGSGYSEYEPLETTAAGLERALSTADPAVTVLLPAAK